LGARAIYALFFLSGISGLVYQVVWVRLFGNLFGNTLHSAATVSGVFLCGLGVGSYLVGRWIDRRYAGDPRAPLRSYARFELGIAALGLAVALVLPLLEPLSAAISSYRVGPEGWRELSHGSHLARHLLAALLLAPITLLMGGTLTLLIRHLVRRDLALAGWRIGALYGINTLGAATGAFISDFALIPRLGVFGTELFAVALNALAGLGALVLAARLAPGADAATPPRADHPAPVRDAHPAAGVRLAPTGLALFCAGVTAMGLQILWFRYLTSVIGSYRSVFSLLLTVILLGLWLGSTLGGWVARRSRRPASVYIAIQALLVAVALVSFEFFAFDISVSLRARHAAAGAVMRGWIDAWVNLRPALMLAGAPAVLMGFGFPLANAHVQKVEASVGARAGGLYLWNAVGNLVGALATSFVLLPALGLQNSVGVLAALAALGMGAIAAGAMEEAPVLRRVLAVGSLGLALTLSLWALLPVDRIIGRSVPRSFAGGQRVLSVSEGVNETIAVLEIPGVERRLFTNGHSMSSTHPLAQRYMRLFAHVPLLTMESPERVLVICFGVGNTAHAASLHPSVTRIDAVDLSKDVIRHAEWFRDSNRDVIDDPRVRVYINDGRQHLRMQPEGSYDLITLEPPPISYAGVSSLYSREFYELARTRLAPGGALTQWLPAYQVSEGAARAVVRAFLDVFPGAVLLSGFRSELILVGSRDGAPTFDLPAVEARIAARPEVARDLARIDVETLTALVGTFVADGETLDRGTRGVAPVTDDWPVMEYSVHARLFETRLPADLFDPSRVATWCPSCFVDGSPRPEVADLEGYLKALSVWYRSEEFLTHRSMDRAVDPTRLDLPTGDPHIATALRRSRYLQRVFGVAPGSLALR